MHTRCLNENVYNSKKQSCTLMDKQNYYIPYVDLDDACVLIVSGKNKELLTVKALPLFMFDSFYELGIENGVHPIVFNSETEQWLKLLENELDCKCVLIDESSYKKMDVTYNLKFNFNCSLSLT